jgi:Mce-associated membrane protein
MTGRLAQLSRRKQAPAATDDAATDLTASADNAAANADNVGNPAGNADEAAAAATADVARRGSRQGRRRAGRRAGPSRRPSAGTQILVLLALVALVLAIALVSLRHRGNELSDTDGGAQKAMFAAATAAQDLSSYDYRTLESDIKTAAAQTTGQLRTDYEKQAQAIMATARQQQVVVNAQSVKSGVVSASSGEVGVLVFLNRTTSKTAGSAASQQRTPDQLRLLMTMKKVGDRWLVAKVDVM